MGKIIIKQNFKFPVTVVGNRLEWMDLKNLWSVSMMAVVSKKMVFWPEIGDNSGGLVLVSISSNWFVS